MTDSTAGGDADARALDDVLKEAKEAFALAEEREAENRAAALDDLRFARLDEQWPAEVRRERERDGRPCLTINRMPAYLSKINWTAAITAAIALLAAFGLDLTEAQKSAVLTLAGVAGPTVIFIWRTWFTDRGAR